MSVTTDLASARQIKAFARASGETHPSNKPKELRAALSELITTAELFEALACCASTAPTTLARYTKRQAALYDAIQAARALLGQ